MTQREKNERDSRGAAEGSGGDGNPSMAGCLARVETASSSASFARDPTAAAAFSSAICFSLLVGGSSVGLAVTSDELAVVRSSALSTGGCGAGR